MEAEEWHLIEEPSTEMTKPRGGRAFPPTLQGGGIDRPFVEDARHHPARLGAPPCPLFFVWVFLVVVKLDHRAIFSTSLLLVVGPEGGATSHATGGGEAVGGSRPFGGEGPRALRPSSQGPKAECIESEAT